jgi:hypothetical protein
MSNETWQHWAQSLQRNHLKGIALTLLEGAGPIKIILSQVMLSTAPFFAGSNRGDWQAVAEMLEDETMSRDFSKFLREEDAQ